MTMLNITPDPHSRNYPRDMHHHYTIYSKFTIFLHPVHRHKNIIDYFTISIQQINKYSTKESISNIFIVHFMLFSI